VSIASTESNDTQRISAPPLPDVSVALADPWLVVRFGAPHAVASWAIVGGGIRTASAVAWLRIRNADLAPHVDARDLLAERMAAAGLGDAIGLMTSASLDGYADVTREADGVSARCVATVGLGNALRAGDPPGIGSTIARVGTINLLVRVSARLTPEAMLETLALAAEARALAVREAAVPSQRSGLPSTGTGTDCIVVAAPLGEPAECYAGKHTALGHVVGAAAVDAVGLGVGRWSEKQRK
jgi:adenosylcobinamide amidohydrolase